MPLQNPTPAKSRIPFSCVSRIDNKVMKSVHQPCSSTSSSLNAKRQTVPAAESLNSLSLSSSFSKSRSGAATKFLVTARKKALHLNSMQRQTILANNRALARSLQKVKEENSQLRNQILELKSEANGLRLQLSTLQALNNTEEAFKKEVEEGVEAELQTVMSEVGNLVTDVTESLTRGTDSLLRIQMIAKQHSHKGRPSSADSAVTPAEVSGLRNMTKRLSRDSILFKRQSLLAPVAVVHRDVGVRGEEATTKIPDLSTPLETSSLDNDEDHPPIAFTDEDQQMSEQQSKKLETLNEDEEYRFAPSHSYGSANGKVRSGRYSTFLPRPRLLFLKDTTEKEAVLEQQDESSEDSLGPELENDIPDEGISPNQNDSLQKIPCTSVSPQTDKKEGTAVSIEKTKLSEGASSEGQQQTTADTGGKKYLGSPDSPSCSPGSAQNVNETFTVIKTPISENLAVNEQAFVVLKAESKCKKRTEKSDPGKVGGGGRKVKKKNISDTKKICQPGETNRDPRMVVFDISPECDNSKSSAFDIFEKYAFNRENKRLASSKDSPEVVQKSRKTGERKPKTEERNQRAHSEPKENAEENQECQKSSKDRKIIVDTIGCEEPKQGSTTETGSPNHRSLSALGNISDSNISSDGEGGRSSRRAAASVCYKEPSLSRKMRRENKTVFGKNDWGL